MQHRGIDIGTGSTRRTLSGGVLLLVAACALASGSTAAADSVLRKCVAADGSASYQNTPCPSDSAAAWEREFEPRDEPDPPPARAATHAPGRHESARSTSATSAAAARASSSTLAGRQAACDAARRHRKATLDAVGLARTYDLLSRLDREVWAACKTLGP